MGHRGDAHSRAYDWVHRRLVAYRKDSVRHAAQRLPPIAPHGHVRYARSFASIITGASVCSPPGCVESVEMKLQVKTVPIDSLHSELKVRLSDPQYRVGHLTSIDGAQVVLLILNTADGTGELWQSE